MKNTLPAPVILLLVIFTVAVIFFCNGLLAVWLEAGAAP